ncbi:AGC family protein kinase [Histomonas meleagridis]|uniref:AGC family protein kinase n=1 Tax=Histomonas meleagridis TaxID=135588 RepID=UPI00355AB3D6|nr:AGC family protein kinase [Histomonas meleagridis]KAH0803075.1 AGC family protein kinase [Histomonas meleagridis]
MSSEPLDGNLLRKTHFLGAWSSCYVELNKTTLTIRKKKSSKKVDKTIEITHDTRIRFLEDCKKPKIVIEIDDNPKNNISFRTKDSNLLLQWVVALRSAAFYNPQISMDSFKIIVVLGRGFFGKVMLVEKIDTKELFALKTVHKVRLIKSKKVQTILAERSILGKVNHPFIVDLCFAFQTAEKFYLGLEYVPGGDLFFLLKKFKKFPLSQVKLFIAEIALALEHLHTIGVVYRDLKPENILIAADGHIKLTDFGLSKNISIPKLTKTFCGTADYMAPEVVNQRLYGYSVDWWALGILTYTLLFGYSPFYDENKAKLFHNISNVDPKFPEGTDRVTIDFISGLLIKEPGMRMRYENIIEHPFFKPFKFDDVLSKKYTPEFIPEIKNPYRPTYFDDEFTNEAAVDSIATPNLITEHEQFNGFSYIEDDS